MGREEHWRQRLLELKSDLRLKQVAMAKAMNIDPTYLSRLLYAPGKAGRKNLGLDTILACRKAFNLSADWFDLPLGSALPSGQQTSPAWLGVASPTGPNTVVPLNGVRWPFKQVTYSRLMELQSKLGARAGREALNDIDQLLDVVVTKWERAASKKRTSK